ncbi:hypothetical protein C0992_000985 [Termitomyces sp. T32_za158]|nr:hypothetical protein C0992_000985 [Termitomyces sp. T32_za158]
MADMDVDVEPSPSVKGKEKEGKARFEVKKASIVRLIKDQRPMTSAMRLGEYAM